ncbi:hypothetical protein DSN97_04980 [Deferribacteraceae bacterium V6Fe1]|nr:hypothetical protein DSN97_04980 [Deferribacteraceae bacterium V6Fe1]
MFQYVNFGLELYKNYKKDISLKKALNDNLIREINYNILIFGEMEKVEKDKLKKLINLLETNYYDYLVNSFVNVRELVKDRKISIDESKIKNKNFLKWIGKDPSFIDILEKVYLRIKVLKSLAKVDIARRKDSYQYVKLLLLVLKKELFVIRDLYN